MSLNEVFVDLITNLQPENVPLEYISFAQYVDRSGAQRLIRGEELKHFMTNPHQYDVIEARVTLNVEKIKQLFWIRNKEFFLELRRKVLDLYQN